VKLRALVIGVAIAVSLAPALASAQGFRGGGGSGFRGGGGSFKGHSGGGGFVNRGFKSVAPKSVFPQYVDPWKSWPPSAVRRHHGFNGHGHFQGQQFVPFAGTGTSVVTFAPTPAVVAPEPAAFSMPTLVEHPTGWYQLHGDGVYTPYRWVWIPKPPPAPVPPPEPPPPARAPDPPAPQVILPPRGPTDPAYRWTDDTGIVTTWTNRLDRVPRRFRDQAQASPERD
jgi:hypothetical protein